METRQGVQLCPEGTKVCSLPMRNGNMLLDNVSMPQIVVCSLPMRNGNIELGFITNKKDSFVAYL